MPVGSRTLRCAIIALGFSFVGCGGGDGTGPGTPREVPVAAVAVTGAPTAPVLVGATLQLSATARDAAGAPLVGRAMAWRSSDTLVARVTAAGLVSAMAPGRATITAASDAVESGTPLDVRVGGALGVDGGIIAVFGGAVTMFVPAGALAQPSVLTAAVPSPLPEDARLVGGTAVDLAPAGLAFAKPVTLSLAYDPAKLPTGVTEASLQVYALQGSTWTPIAASAVDGAARTVRANVTSTGVFAVLTTPVASVAVAGAPASGQLYVGQTARLTAVPRDEAGNALAGRAVVWTSSDPSVVRVDANGVATAGAVGSAVVTAAVEGRTAAAALAVALAPVATVTIAPATAPAALFVGQWVQLGATTSDSSGAPLAGRPVTWTSSDTAAVRVDLTGRVTAVAAGTATVTAASGAASAHRTFAVEALAPNDCPAADEWVTYQGDRCHTGYVAATLAPAAFRRLWVDTVAAAGVALNPVVAGGGNVYVTNSPYSGSKGLTVIAAASGARRWTRDMSTLDYVHPPAYGNGRLYLTTGGHSNSYLWSFDPNDGTLLFRSSYANQWSSWYSPVVHEGSVFMGGGYYGGMYRFNAADGGRTWFAQTNQNDAWTPAVSGKFVYLYDGKLSVVNAATGALVWSIADPLVSYGGATLTVALGGGNRVLAIVGTRLIAYDVAALRTAWTQTGTFTGIPTVRDGVLYVTNNRQIEARRESDGSLLWLWVPPAGEPVGTTVVTDNLLFVSTSAATYAVDLATHAHVWSYPAGGKLALSKAQGVLYIAQTDGQLTAVAVR
jgi:uncharacterized protein YjdB